MSVAVFRDELFLRHEIEPGHPESPNRLRAVYEMLESYPKRDSLSFPRPRDATDEELLRVHAPEYLERVKSTAAVDHFRFDLDTAVNRHSHDAARRAAGAAMGAAETAVRGTAEASFALVRPPGHHAERDRAMGFCLFNNVAVAAEYALRDLGRTRVAIFDWDVHHGNGTQHAFYDRGDVLYASIHQSPFYPGTGAVDEAGRGDGAGFTINMPLDAGAGDYNYLYLMDRVLRDALIRFRPELILVSAGFDTHARDPLAYMRMSTGGYGCMTELLLDIAREIPERPPLAFVLEGGYDTRSLSEGVAAVLDALLGAAMDWRAVLGAEAPGASLTSLADRLNRPDLRSDR